MDDREAILYDACANLGNDEMKIILAVPRYRQGRRALELLG